MITRGASRARNPRPLQSSWPAQAPPRRRFEPLGGDAHTQAAIAGGIAEAFYKCVPDIIAGVVRKRLPPRFVQVIDDFRKRFPLDAAGRPRYPRVLAISGSFLSSAPGRR